MTDADGARTSAIHTPDTKTPASAGNVKNLKKPWRMNVLTKTEWHQTLSSPKTTRFLDEALEADRLQAESEKRLERARLVAKYLSRFIPTEPK